MRHSCVVCIGRLCILQPQGQSGISRVDNGRFFLLFGITCKRFLITFPSLFSLTRPHIYSCICFYSELWPHNVKDIMGHSERYNREIFSWYFFNSLPVFHIDIKPFPYLSSGKHKKLPNPYLPSANRQRTACATAESKIVQLISYLRYDLTFKALEKTSILTD